MNPNLKLKNSDKSGIAKAFALMSQLGINSLVIMAVCFFMGKGLDYLFGTTPIIMFAFIVLGILTAMWNLYKTVMAQMPDPNIIPKTNRTDTNEIGDDYDD